MTGPTQPGDENDPDTSPTTPTAARDGGTAVSPEPGLGADPGPTRWQQARGRARPSSWSRRGAVVASGIVGLIVGAVLAGVVVAATPLGHGHAGPGRPDRPAAERDGGPGPAGRRHHGPQAEGSLGDRGPAGRGEGGGRTIQLPPGAVVQIAPG